MTELALGLGIGWAAGITPGPLHTLIIVTAVQRGFRAGARVAVAPPLADIPVVPLSLLAVGAMSDGVVRGLSAAGGLFVIWLGIDTLRAARRADPEPVRSGSDVAKGIVTNLLSPYPWLFWFTVGAPILVTAWEDAPVDAVAFVAGFYGTLVGAKLGVAWLASHGRRLLGTPWYGRLIAASGIMLIFMGLILLRGAFVT